MKIINWLKANKDRLSLTKKMKKLTITKIIMIQNNRTLRVGVGKHTGRWYLRIDLWSVGYRLTYGN